MLEKIYEDAVHATNRSKRSASTPYLKLIAQTKREVEQLLSANRALEAEVGRLQAQVEVIEAKAQADRQEHERQIQALSTQIAAITGTDTWRLAQALRRIGVRIAPHGTLRQRCLRRWVRMLGVREQ